MSQNRRTVLEWPLRRPSWNAVLPVVERRQRQTVGRLAGEEIVVVGEILQFGQRTNFRRNLTGEKIVGNVQLLQAYHLGDSFRQGAGELIKANVQHRQVKQLSDIRVKAAGKIIIDEENLIQGRAHVADAGGDTAGKLIIGKDDNRGRQMTEIRRDALSEPIVIDKQSIKILLKKLRWKGAFEVIESDVEVVKAGEG